MNWFRKLPIRIKLAVFVMGIVGVTMLLSLTAVIINHHQTVRTAFVEEISSAAHVIGVNSRPALEFDDPVNAEEKLSSLGLTPSVVFACTLDFEDEVFATYRPNLDESEDIPEKSSEGESYFESNGYLHVFEEIEDSQGEHLGTIYMRASTSTLSAALRREIFIAAAILLGSAVFAVLFGFAVQRVISSPILKLAAMTTKVSQTADYSLRVEKQTDDELGILCDGFNSMLEQIQARDRQLAEYRADLEEQVETRTQHLQQKTEELERSNRDLEEFAYIASHDLKEPLRGITNYSTFIAEDYGDKLDDEGRDKINTLNRLCKRMEDLIDSLLRYSRVGRTELAIRETDLNEMVAEVADAMHVTLNEQNVDLRVPRPLPTATCDAVRVRELFRNLIENAVKYSDKEDKWVEVGFIEPSDQDEAVPNDSGDAQQSVMVFYVRDNGIGIRDKHIDNIFRIFKRLHGRDKFGGGTGAGLTFAKKIVERHDGKIWVESEFGEGSTFFFTLQQDGSNDES